MRGTIPILALALSAARGIGAGLPEGPTPDVPREGRAPGDYPNHTVIGVSWKMETRGTDDIRMDILGQGPLPWSLTAFAPGRYAPRLHVGDPEAASVNLGVDAFDVVFSGRIYDWSLDLEPWASCGAAWNPDPARGVILASVRRNGQEWGGPAFHGVVSIAVDVDTGAGYSMVDGSFGTGGLEVRVDQAGTEGAGIIDTAVAWFPYDMGWIGGHVATPDDDIEVRWHAEGRHSSRLPSDASEIVSWDEDQTVPIPPARVRLPGVNASGDGMLFTHSIDHQVGSTPRICAADPMADGSGWEVVMRPDNATDHEYMEDRGLAFSFLYIPYDSEHLTGGHIRGRDANVLNGRGQFTIRRLVTGRYELAIPGKTDADGFLLLGAAGRLASDTSLVGRNFLSYQAVPGDRFRIESRYYEGGGETPLEDTDFYFAWVDYVQPLAPPGFALTVEPPAITRHPASLDIEAGVDIEFQVEATGDAPLQYQWTKDGADLPGETGTALLLPEVGLEDAGAYRVRVTNGGGEATSNSAILRVLALPALTLQPVDVEAFTGDSVQLEAAATGTPPLRYQWQKDGADIAGATDPVLRLQDLEPADAGQYRVRVSNDLGETYSTTGRLTIIAVERAPVILVQPRDMTVQEGTEVAFTVEASGFPPPQFRWRFNGEDIANADAATLTLSRVSADASGAYQVTVFNSAGTVNSRMAVLTVVAAPVAPVITEHPASTTVAPGGTVTFRVAATGTPPLSYRWQFNGEDIANADAATLTLSRVSADASGAYRVVVSNSGGDAVSNAAILAVEGAPTPPRISAGPQDRTVTRGDAVAFSVTASGSPPLSYQWQMNGVDIPGATADRHEIAEAALSHAGSYRVIVRNPHGSVISEEATLVVLAPIVPPMVVSHPQSLTVREGESAAFTVVSTGSPPLAYQWQFNGTDIPGATASRHDIEAATSAHAGSYRVRVGNTGGSVISNEATLVVQLPVVPPLVVEHPRSLAVTEGESAAFMVVSTGSAPLVYQWRFNGVDIPGATADRHEIAEATLSHAGSYRVVVSNTRGSAISNPAILDVNERPPDGAVPVIVTQPRSRAALRGSTISFSVEATGNEPLSYQWRFGESNIPGARSSTFTIGNVQQVDTGSYRVVVSSADGFSVESDAAELSIATAPILLRQPEARSLPEGGTAVFEVEAEGIPPLSYQWQFNGTNIPGAASRQAAFRIEGVGPGDEGAYRVVVTDAQGTTVSEEARLTVTEALPDLIIDRVSLRGNVLTIEWGGGPGIVLQIKADLDDPVWQDVPGSEGRNSIQQLTLGFSAWYRLIRR